MRYLPLSDADRAAMLARTGQTSVDAFFADVPQKARLDAPVALPYAQSEMAVERHLSALAAANLPASHAAFFVGCGAYRHHVPASVDHIIQRSEFLTTYTPYQPEIAQGTLQTLFEFQTQVALLTGMEVANASMYDGSTATAEAAMMACRITKRRKILASGGLHPHYGACVATLAEAAGLHYVQDRPRFDGEAQILSQLDDETACVIVQSPNFFGTVTDIEAIAKKVQARGALLIFVFTEAMSLGLLRSPGEMGADIVVGEGQSIGNSLNFGGPYVGLFASREKFIRQMPGRLAGETVDMDGRTGYVLTLSTREQHIRREKATSNICTNSGLCALAFTAHLTLLGEAGLRKVARINHYLAQDLADALSEVPGVELLTERFFNEIAIRLPVAANLAVEHLALQGILAGVPASRFWADRDMQNVLILAATELNQRDDIAKLAGAMRAFLASR